MTPSRTLRPGLALAVASGGTFLSFLDATITNLAMPDMAHTFPVTLTTLSWVVTAYSILFAAVLAPAGAMADALGRARLFVLGIGIFTVASLVVAAAPAFWVVLLGRAIQAVGGALMVPSSLGLVLAETPIERRKSAIAIWGAAGALAAAVGPALGGVAVDAFGWRSLFLINVPFGAWLVTATRSFVRGEPRAGRVPDLVGSTTLAVALGALVYAITQGPNRSWSDTTVVGCFVLAAVAAVFTLDRSRRHARPALDLHLWDNSAFSAATVASFGFGAALYTTLLTGVMFLVQVWHTSERHAGLVMTPGALAAAAAGVVIGRTTRPPSPRVLIVLGSALIAVACVLLALRLGTTPSYLSLWLPAGIASGIGSGLCGLAISSAGAMSVPPLKFASGTGVLGAFRQMGGALGVAVMTAILSLHGSAVAHFQGVYWFAAGMAALAAIGGLAVRFDRGALVGAQPTEPAATATAQSGA